jgi:hypothetical protein
LNIKKPLLVMGAVASVGVAGLAGSHAVSAATSSPHDSLVDRIASKFNLNKDEVAKVFEEEKAVHHAEMQQKMEERLDTAVADGKITEEQKAKILAKLEELRKGHELWKDKTPEERHNAKLELHQGLEQWAEDNDIPLDLLHFKMHVKHGGPGMGFVKHHIE